MKNKLLNVSMNGRMAYTIMCVEAYLKNKHPDRDWSLVAKTLWESTSTNWGDWSDRYASFIPDVLFSYQDEIPDNMTEDEYHSLMAAYDGITEGREDDPDDELNYILSLPFEIAMVYEGTTIGDGTESFGIVAQAEKILQKNGITLPDYKKVVFSSADELNGWGNDFDGRYLSIII